MNPEAIQGIFQAIQPFTLLAVVCGAVHGLVMGMLPGMTTSAGIIIALPLTFILDPVTSIALLLGVYAGGMTGGSFAAILINIPGTPSASATVIDGYPMTLKGEAGRALGTSIFASFGGGVFSFCCLFLIAPLLAKIALQFRAPDLFGLVFFGLTVISSFATKSPVKGIISALIGLIIITVGQDPLMGTARFTFGSAEMLAGIHFLPAMVGLFAIPEIIQSLSDDIHARKLGKMPLGKLLPSWKDFKDMPIPALIGAVFGVFVGILPGASGPISVFISYDYTKKLSKHPERFGKGCVEGVATTEASNSAVCGGALIPMMTLGIPGDPVTAILMGALLVHGLVPGPLLFVEHATYAYTVIFTYFMAVVAVAVVALSSIRIIVKLLATPKSLFLPIIFTLCVLGSYALRNSFFDIACMFFFGLVAIYFKWLDIPVVPCLLALVLGPQLEEHMRVSLTASRGDVSIFFTSPICLTFFCLSAISIFWPYIFERIIKSKTKATIKTT